MILALLACPRPNEFAVTITPSNPLPWHRLDCRVPAEHAAAVEWLVDGSPIFSGPSLPPFTAQPGSLVSCRADRGRAEVEIDGPDVLLVVMDDLGVERLTSYEPGGEARTPTIDALAAQGTVFERAYATPVCSPSRAALVTGRHPRRYGIGGVLHREQEFELPADEATLAEAVERAGYVSTIVGKWHLSGESSPSGPDNPDEQGFEHIGALGNLHEKYLEEEWSYTHWERYERGRVSISSKYATTDSVDSLIEAKGKSDGPGLYVLSFNAPHWPFHEPPASLLERAVQPGASDDELFLAMVEALDTELQRALDAFDLDRTLVFITSDNGSPSFNGEEAKGTFSEAGIRVPLIVAGGPVQPARVQVPVHLVDVFPTVAQLVGVDGGAIDGESLFPLLGWPGVWSREFVYTETFKPPGPPPYRKDTRAMISSSHKLVRYIEDDTVTEEFFQIDGLHAVPLEGHGKEYERLVESLNAIELEYEH